MPLSPADLVALSPLLDQALALPEPAREAWLAGLPPAQQRYAPVLREMLARRADTADDGLLQALPQLPSAGPALAAGDRVGPYRVLRELGRGGMGSVWLAERADGSFRRQVALKLPRLAWDEGLAARMARERDIGALLEHPHIARLYDAGVDEQGRPYLALEYVDGQPIDAWCAARGLSVRERLRLFVQVVRAVAYAHGRLVVHRDLKPSNVLVDGQGQVHLLDFGIAKLLDGASPDAAGLTQQQGRLLTPLYASPEQVAGEAVTVQSDVYSLGVLLYELLTGALPIVPERSTHGAAELAVLRGDAALASGRARDKATAKALRGEVDAILAQAMRREPRGRYATADALALDIERHLAGETVSARPDSALYRLRKLLRRHRLPVAAAVTAAGALVSGAAVSVVQARHAADAAERARVVKQFVIDVFKVNATDSAVKAELRKLPAELLLDNGARLIERNFAGQPQLQAELYGVVAGIFLDMGLPERAGEYATRQVAQLAATGAPPAEQAAALLQQGQAFFDQDRFVEADLRTRRAAELAAGNRALKLSADMQQARVLWRLGQVPQAEKQLAAVEATLAQGERQPSLVRANALALRADLVQLAGRFDEGVPLMKAAADEAVAVEGALSPRAIDLRLELAKRLVQRFRFDEAQPLRDGALGALRVLGGGHAVRASLEESAAARQSLMMGHSRFAEVAALIERNREQAAAGERPFPETVRARLDFELGWSCLMYGDLPCAVRLLGPVQATMEAAATSPRLRFFQAAVYGDLATLRGQHDEAERLLKIRSEARAAQGHGRQLFAAFDYIIRSNNLVMAARYADAEKVLDAAPDFQAEAKGGADADSYGLALRIARARLQLERGDLAPALALDVKFENASAGPLITEAFRAVKAEALCRSGRAAEGLALLQEVLAFYTPVMHPNAPLLARYRATAGLCALAAGHRKEALELARAAHPAFDEKSLAGAWYRRPYLELEQRLARH